MRAENLLVDVSCVEVSVCESKTVRKLVEMMRSGIMARVPILRETAEDTYRVVAGAELVEAARTLCESDDMYEQVEAIVVKDDESEHMVRKQLAITLF